MSKTIVIVGVLDKMGSTNLYMAGSFMKKDIRVVPVNYRTIISNYGADYFYRLLMHVIDKENPDLILFSKCNGISPDIVKTCTNRTDTWLWNMDHYNTIQKIPEVVEHAKFATFSSCTSPATADWFEKHGVKKCYHIFEGVDTKIYKPRKSVKEFKADISFIGSSTEERNIYKEVLEKLMNAKFYGPGYNDEVVDEQFAKVCSSSKCMLSLNVHNNEPDYFSDRVFRYLACGACTFHLDNTGTLNKWFKDGKDIVYFKDINDLIVKLSTLTDDIAKRIGKSGRKKVVNNYTWDHTVEKIIKIAGL